MATREWHSHFKSKHSHRYEMTRHQTSANRHRNQRNDGNKRGKAADEGKDEKEEKRFVVHAKIDAKKCKQMIGQDFDLRHEEQML